MTIIISNNYLLLSIIILSIIIIIIIVCVPITNVMQNMAATKDLGHTTCKSLQQRIWRHFDITSSQVIVVLRFYLNCSARALSPE